MGFRFDIGEKPDELFDEAVRVVNEAKNASASLLQRKLSLGYARAARLLDELENAGVIGPFDGSIPRKILQKEYVRPKIDPEKIVDYHIPKFHTPIIKEVLVPIDQLDHLLIVGNPQSKKMEFVETLIVSQLMRKTPDQFNLIIVDESNYLLKFGGIPHLLSPVISDYDKVLSALKWTLVEIDRRQKTETAKNSWSQIWFIARLYDHDMEIDSMLTRITSFGHLFGIHMIIIVDQASGAYISSQVKANIPSRLVFRTTSASDSTLAGVRGADKLKMDQAILRQGESDDKVISPLYISETDVKEVIATIQYT